MRAYECLSAVIYHTLSRLKWDRETQTMASFSLYTYILHRRRCLHFFFSFFSLNFFFLIYLFHMFCVGRYRYSVMHHFATFASYSYGHFYLFYSALCRYAWCFMGTNGERDDVIRVFHASIFCVFHYYSPFFSRSFSHCLSRILMVLTLKWPYTSISGTLTANVFSERGSQSTKIATLILIEIEDLGFTITFPILITNKELNRFGRYDFIRYLTRNSGIKLWYT